MTGGKCPRTLQNVLFVSTDVRKLGSVCTQGIDCVCTQLLRNKPCDAKQCSKLPAGKINSSPAV